MATSSSVVDIPAGEMRMGPAWETHLSDVLAMAAAGLRLFPCVPKKKKPLIHSWPSRASSDPTVIRAWYTQFRGCNWAVATGPGSGVFVLDIDEKKGAESLSALETHHGTIPATRRSITARGEHHWFKYPANRKVCTSVDTLGAGLDVRGDGGYAMAPGSIHPNGSRYRWFDFAQPAAEAPEWMLDRVCNAKQTKIPTEILRECSVLAGGHRNDGLTRYAGALRRKGAEILELERKLLDANARRCYPPLEDKEVLGIAASVARYAVGGPDPLQRAWEASSAANYPSNESRFLGLCRCLQTARQGLEIALPLKRIAALMNLHWTTVGDYRKALVKQGILVPVGQYVRQRLAGTYRYFEPFPRGNETTLTRESRTTLTRTPPLTRSLTSGLVRIPDYALVGNIYRPSEDEGEPLNPSEDVTALVGESATGRRYQI